MSLHFIPHQQTNLIVNTYTISEYAGEQARMIDWESNTMHQHTYHLIASSDWQSWAVLSLTICIVRKWKCLINRRFEPGSICYETSTLTSRPTKQLDLKGKYFVCVLHESTDIMEYFQTLLISKSVICEMISVGNELCRYSLMLVMTYVGNDLYR